MIYSKYPYQWRKEEENYEWMGYHGVEILAEKVEGEQRIVQVFSTDPKDFLRADLQPGRTVEK